MFSLTGRMGTKPEARRAESGDGVLGDGAASPLPTS